MTPGPQRPDVIHSQAHPGWRTPEAIIATRRLSTPGLLTFLNLEPFANFSTARQRS